MAMRSIGRCAAWWGVAIALLFSATPPAWAREGVIEFNQQRALAGSVTAGDAAGFPITISEPGSYVLTSNLTVADENDGALDITATDVTIDLNGFTVAGPRTCTGFGPTLSCGAASGVDGIYSTASGTVLKNGIVRGFGVRGVNIGDVCRVEDVTASENPSTGIRVGGDCVVRGAIAVRNGYGIYTSQTGTRVVNSAARGNLVHGITVWEGGAVQGCASNGNGSNGITLGGHSNALDNASSENTIDGIEAVAMSMVHGNAVWTNGGYGLDLSAYTPYARNTIMNNTTGTVNSGIPVGFNNCNGSTTCP